VRDLFKEFGSKNKEAPPGAKAPVETSPPVQPQDIDAGAHEAATSPKNERKEPSDLQKEAGNYKKGKISLQGLNILIENPRGSDRSGKDRDGTAWSHTMSDHYGYIRGSMGADGDALDVYVGPKPDSDKVFVVDQIDQGNGKFDEHKIMLGFANKHAAVKAYEANFNEGWKVGQVTELSIRAFKDWIKNGDTDLPMSDPSAYKPVDEPEVVVASAASKARAQAMNLAKKAAA
jgi:hypothetical protein